VLSSSQTLQLPLPTWSK